MFYWIVYGITELGQRNAMSSPKMKSFVWKETSAFRAMEQNFVT